MKVKLPRFTTRYTNSDGIDMWAYKPPKRAIKAGVVCALNLQASTTATKKTINTMNFKLDAWRQDVVSQEIPTDKSTLYSLFRFYQTTFSFNKLMPQSQRDYKNVLNNAMMTKVEGVTLSNIKLCNLKRRHIKLAYEKWLIRGTRIANLTYSILHKVVEIALEHDILIANPVSNIEKRKSTPRKIMWTTEQVKLFLDTCYSEWKWRNIGLIGQMAYEWSQRIGDMRKLQWSSLDLNKGVLNLEQSKRRAEVQIPISSNLLDMLHNQKRDFDFQEYVAPSLAPINGLYKPYDITKVSHYVNDIKAACGLPSDLHISDMRRTAITQMVEAGVDITQIMAVSGHQNVQSVTPYIKHTLAASKSAIEKRNIYLDK